MNVGRCDEMFYKLMTAVTTASSHASQICGDTSIICSSFYNLIVHVIEGSTYDPDETKEEGTKGKGA